MARKKKVKTQTQIEKEQNVYSIQDFEKPKAENIEKRYVRIHHYMLNHINYINLSSSAKVLLTYMLDWAFASDEFAKNHTFDYSTTMLSRKGIMSNKTTISALEELQYYGFIQKENNARRDGGFTQKWSFSDNWYREIRKKLPKKSSK